VKLPALSSLRSRIFLASALVAVLSVAFAIQFVRRRVADEADAELRRSLDRAARLVEQHHGSRLDNLTAQARLIADLPTLAAAVYTAHPPTVQPIAEDLKARSRSDLISVTSAEGTLLAWVGATSERIHAAAVGEALRGNEALSFLSTPHAVLEVVTVPITVGPTPREPLGALSLGFALDDGLARQFKALTDSEVAFALDGSVRASTLPERDAAALAGLMAATGVGLVNIGADEYVGVSRRLLAQEATGPVALILRSRSERLQVLRTFRTALLGGSLLGLLVAVLLSFAVAGTITRPLADLTKVMREMTATGDLARRISLGPGWRDDDAAVLVRTFNALTEAIARFQGEAALRERLSALGRLSTVIAHEVRNPLMIIKSSLAVLRRDSLSPGDAREVAADIDQQVARLNRIVEGVLDFARPLRLEYAAADLNALCRDAVAATLALEPALRSDVEPEPALARVETDAERLRTALLNVLSNAREAVAARRSAEPERRDDGAPDVTLRLEAPGRGRAAIVVRDRGRGIAEPDLATVFEPYFTTKRTGTGLGLAIAKNIVEALGGTIRISSRLGEGTEVRIEIPTTGAGHGSKAGAAERVQA
jgi:signal transduction histidine kinase